jgi:hypothetical protein
MLRFNGVYPKKERKIIHKDEEVLSSPNRTVIAQFVARRKGYKVEGQTGVTGTYPTQCHHDGMVLSL